MTDDELSAIEARANAAESDLRRVLDALGIGEGATALDAVACIETMHEAGQAWCQTIARLHAELDALRAIIESGAGASNGEAELLRAEVEKESMLRAELTAEVGRLKARVPRVCAGCFGAGLFPAGRPDARRCLACDGRGAVWGTP